MKLKGRNWGRKEERGGGNKREKKREWKGVKERKRERV